MHSRWILPLLLLFATVEAVANPAGIGTHWLPLIDRLRAERIDTVGNWDRRQFLGAAAKIQWRHLSEAPPTVASGSRDSAFFIWDANVVYVSDDIPDDLQSSLPKLELHEALGAVGYEDHDYALSTVLVELGELPAADRQRLRRKFSSANFRRRYVIMAGGTSVSGGGDLDSIALKAAVLERIEKQSGGFARFTGDFVKQYPRIGFEPVATGSTVFIKYRSTRMKRGPGQSEAIEIHFPRQRWRQPGPARDALVEEVAEKVTEIFPAISGSDLRAFHPPICKPGLSLAFPATRDPSVAAIQEARAAVVLGCHREFIADTGTETTAPAPAISERPREAGFYHFDCAFLFENGREDYEINARAGNGVLTTHAMNVNDVMVQATTRVSAGGQLTGFLLRYFPAGTDGVTVGPVAAVGGDHGEISAVIGGTNVTYRCQKAR